MDIEQRTGASVGRSCSSYADDARSWRAPARQPARPGHSACHPSRPLAPYVNPDSGRWRGPSWFLEVPVILSGRCLAVWATAALVGGPGSRLAASRILWPELPLQLHKAPDPGAVGTEVGLDVGGRRLNGGHVDAEQLRAPL